MGRLPQCHDWHILKQHISDDGSSDVRVRNPLLLLSRAQGSPRPPVGTPQGFAGQRQDEKKCPAWQLLTQGPAEPDSGHRGRQVQERSARRLCAGEARDKAEKPVKHAARSLNVLTRIWGSSSWGGCGWRQRPRGFGRWWGSSRLLRAAERPPNQPKGDGAGEGPQGRGSDGHLRVTSLSLRLCAFRCLSR